MDSSLLPALLVHSWELEQTQAEVKRASQVSHISHDAPVYQQSAFRARVAITDLLMFSCGLLVRFC